MMYLIYWSLVITSTGYLPLPQGQGVRIGLPPASFNYPTPVSFSEVSLGVPRKLLNLYLIHALLGVCTLSPQKENLFLTRCA